MNKMYKNCWEYLKKNNQDTAICNLCAKILSCKGSAATELRRHLEGVHAFRRNQCVQVLCGTASNSKTNQKDSQNWQLSMGLQNFKM